MTNHETLPKPSSLLRNPISVLGLAVTVVSTAFGLPLMFLDFFSEHPNPYLGVLIYLVLPFVASGGVGIVLLGAFLERRRRARRPDLVVPPFPSIDLNKPAHQVIVTMVMAGALVLVVLLSVTGYRAYHFTESVEFCGLVCHQVMKPEFTAYKYSPHARVTCVQCHVGPGAGWFVRSKLSGLYQVYAVTTKKYPRPIPTPIESLRPAQETCEQCHWPAKFFGAQQKTFMRYLTDEENSPWQIQMLLKIGGGDPEVGATTGIHWHMNISKDIFYIAADEKREVIPWVRVVDHEGRIVEYTSTENPLSPSEIAESEIRRLDCVDCHNRPSHIYYPPERAVERAFEAGRLPRTLPFLKREAIRLLIKPYESQEDGLSEIPENLVKFYQEEYPEVYRKRMAAIQKAAGEVQKIYSSNFFPEMRVDWRAYPSHTGHLYSEGCFRCHDGLHKSPEGRIITKDCNVCHTILGQGPPEELAGAALHEQPFQHPVDLGMDVTEFKCSECHTGTGGL